MIGGSACQGIAHQRALRLYHKTGIAGLDKEIGDYVLALRDDRRKDEETQKYFWKGFGQGADFPQAEKLMGEYVAEPYKGYFFQGLGESTASRNLENNELSFVVEWASKYYIECAYSGYRERLAESMLSGGYGD